MTTRALRMTLLGSLAGVALLLLAWYVARDAPEGEAVVPAAALQPGGADEPRGDVALAGPPRQTPAGEPADAARRAVEETPVHGGAAAEPETEEAEATLLLRGRVVDRGGEPVAGALVFASHQQGFPLDYVAGEESPERAERWQATTGADGRFELRGPEPPTIRLAVCAPGYARHQADGIAVPDTEEHELEPVTGRVEVEARVVPGETVAPAEEREQRRGLRHAVHSEDLADVRGDELGRGLELNRELGGRAACVELDDEALGLDLARALRVEGQLGQEVAPARAQDHHALEVTQLRECRLHLTAQVF